LEKAFRGIEKMKKYEILYDWPIAEIKRLVDSDIAENYADNLIEPNLSLFVTLTEKMRTLGEELLVVKAARNHFTKWTELYSCVLEFSHNFANFPEPSVEKLKLSLIFADKLSTSFPQLDEEEIDENTFELRELAQRIPLKWFSRENSQSIVNSVVIFACDDHQEVRSEITSSIISPSLMFHLMAALNTGHLPASQAILVKRANPSIENSAVSAFARLAVIATGKPVHSARKYERVPSVLNFDRIKPGESYQQWNDVLNVLSEYNSRDEILLKFLTIYHAIENFMFKRPIVELERQKVGMMFSIRDFRRLYDGVEIGDSDALKKLFKSVFDMEVQPGITFKRHLVRQWQGLSPRTDIDSALRLIGLEFDYIQFNDNQALANFSKLVYSVRNAIVHNKETEFHLTFDALDKNQGLCKLIENFLLPSLEEISFYLIGQPNDQFWYRSKEIQLYN